MPSWQDCCCWSYRSNSGGWVTTYCSSIPSRGTYWACWMTQIRRLNMISSCNSRTCGPWMVINWARFMLERLPSIRNRLIYLGTWRTVWRRSIDFTTKISRMNTSSWPWTCCCMGWTVTSTRRVMWISSWTAIRVISVRHRVSTSWWCHGM